MNSVGPIITKYRKEKNLSQAALAKLLQKEGIEVTDKALSKWENGNTDPGAKSLFTLCKILEIKDIYEEIFGVNPYNPLSYLNDEGKERVDEYIRMISTNKKYVKDAAIIPENAPSTRFINLFTLAVSAGTGNFLDDYDSEEIEVDEFVPASADFAVRISGDSMTPMFTDKQIVYVHRQDYVEDGEIGIFSLDGNAYCKRMMRNKKGTALISLNKKYDPIPVTEQSSFYTFGKVVG